MKEIIIPGTTVAMDQEFLKKIKKKQDPAAQVFMKCYDSGDPGEIFEYLKETCKVDSLSPHVETFIRETLKVCKVRGFFYIRGIGAMLGSLVTYPRVCGDSHLPKEMFPALPIGYEDAGTEFWVLLRSGGVISIHHASIPEIVGKSKLPHNPSLLTLLHRRGVIFDIRELLQLHYCLQDAMDNEPGRKLHGGRVLGVVKKVLNCSYEDLKSLGHHSGMEFLLHNYSDFTQNKNGFKLLKKSAQLLKDLQADPAALRWLDLSYLFLPAPPSNLARAVNITTLNLTGNPELFSKKLLMEKLFNILADLPKLRTLVLGDNQLEELPPALESFKNLRKTLVLGDNQLEELPPALEGFKNLRKIDVCNNPMSPMEIEEAKERFPKLNIVHNINPRIYEAVLNPAACVQLEIPDCGFSRLPRHFTHLTALEKLVLDDNPQLDMESALETLAGLPQLKILSLKNCRLRSMPPALAKLTNLEELHLDKNGMEIDQLFTLLAPLTRLRVVNAGDNRVSRKKIPAEGEFPSLEVLNLAHMSFKAKWFATLKMPNLKELCLGEGYIKGPRLDVSPFPHLQSLDLYGNKIKEFHPSVSTLQNLQHLRFKTDDKSDRQLPDWFSGLQQLKSLRLSGRKLKLAQGFQFPANLETLQFNDYVNRAYPAAVYQLKNLTCLAFFDTQIEAFPPEIGNLSRLKEIKTLNLHALKSVAEELAGLTELEVLQLDMQGGKGPEKLPDHFDKLQKLQQLNLRNCSRLDMEKEMEKIKKLPRLHTLSLQGCLKETLPPALAQLTALTHLDLSFNFRLEPVSAMDIISKLENLEELNLQYVEQLKVLPESFSRLNKLRKISFASCKSIDPEPLFAMLCGLPALRELDISDCKFKRLPETIGNLQNLEALNITGTNCKIVPDVLFTLSKLERMVVSRTELTLFTRKKFTKVLPNCKLIG